MQDKTGQASIYREIKETLGLVPQFFYAIPARTLPEQWNLFKDTFLSSEGVFAPKTKELIGAACGAGMGCEYCVPMHSRLAKFHGATEEEVNENAQLVRSVGQWSRLLYGLNYDKELFNKELDQIIKHLENKPRPE